MGIVEDNEHLEELDRKYIWHPFTQMKEWVEEKPIIIAEGRDCFIKDVYGKWYLDGVSSLWVNIFGHKKKEIDDAIKAQLDKIAHSTLIGIEQCPGNQVSRKTDTVGELILLKSSVIPFKGLLFRQRFHCGRGCP